MAEMKNICGKIPMDLHEKVREEIELTESSTQKFLQQVIEEHFNRLDGKGEISMEEGCLSLPGIHESVKRGNRIHVTYMDEDMVEHDEVVEGYLARVMQHEFDHLEGKMFIDHLSPLRKQMIKGKLNAMLKGKAHCTYKVKTVK